MIRRLGDADLDRLRAGREQRRQGRSGRVHDDASAVAGRLARDRGVRFARTVGCAASEDDDVAIAQTAHGGRDDRVDDVGAGVGRRRVDDREPAISLDEGDVRAGRDGGGERHELERRASRGECLQRRQERRVAEHEQPDGHAHGGDRERDVDRLAADRREHRVGADAVDGTERQVVDTDDDVVCRMQRGELASGPLFADA